MEWSFQKLRWHKWLQACMVVNDEWWITVPNTNNRPFFPSFFVCQQLEFQTKHLFVTFSKAVFVKKWTPLPCVARKQELRHLWFVGSLLNCKPWAERRRLLQVFRSIQGGCPKQNKNQGFIWAPKMHLWYENFKHVTSTCKLNTTLMVAFFHCHDSGPFKSTDAKRQIQRQRWVLSDKYSKF